ncbi:MAG: DnaA ATPase domain-containing protein [bacterium]
MFTDHQLKNFETYKSALRHHYGDATFNSWFANLSLINYTDNDVTMGTNNQFTTKQIAQRYSKDMQTIWHRQIGDPKRIYIKTGSGLSANSLQAKAKQYPAYKKPVMGKPKNTLPTTNDLTQNLPSPLNPGLVFETFCIGEANRVAFAAARSIIDDPNERFVFFHGASGRGKTHLLNAIGQEWIKNNPQDNVLYLTYDNLLNGYVNAVLSKSVSELRNYLDQIEILLVDDIHLLRGRKATQEELLNLIDRLIACKKTVVIAGNLPALKLAETGLNYRLADRIGSGMSVQLDKPDYSLRLKILDQMNTVDGQNSTTGITPQHLQTIARRCDASIRELEGAYRTIRLNSRALQFDNSLETLDDEMIRKLLQEQLHASRKDITLEDIKDAVSEEFGVTVLEIESRRRMQPIVKSRHAFCLVARKLTDSPLKQIGAVINRDHTTVLSSIDRAQILAETDPKFADRISALLNRFED